MEFGNSSPTRISEVWPKNIKNLGSVVHGSLYNTHNVFFHLYIFVNKFLPILALISITFALVINSVLVYRLKLFCNLRVVLLSFSFVYFLFIYCNVESTNIWLYFFVKGLYFGFIFDLFKDKCIVKISN
jgi:FlaA1/EpsC-like NDP-sugar epimerase